MICKHNPDEPRQLQQLADYLGETVLQNDAPIATQPLPVFSWSSAFAEWGDLSPQPVNAIIELWSMGILVHLEKADDTLLWGIAFHHLYLYQSPDISLHARGHFLKMRMLGDETPAFLDALIQAKVDYTGEDYYG
jgi:hypothetical protein